MIRDWLIKNKQNLKATVLIQFLLFHYLSKQSKYHQVVHLTEQVCQTRNNAKKRKTTLVEGGIIEITPIEANEAKTACNSGNLNSFFTYRITSVFIRA